MGLISFRTKMASRSPFSAVLDPCSRCFSHHVGKPRLKLRLRLMLRIGLRLRLRLSLVSAQA